MHIYLLLHYICFKLIKLRLMVIYFCTREIVFKISKPRQEDIRFREARRKLVQECHALFGFVSLSSDVYMTINHGMHATFEKK